MRARRVKAAARGALAILCIAVCSVALLGVRYFAFEYSHGDREIVVNLLDKLSPRGDRP
jgi:hypothetical protein